MFLLFLNCHNMTFLTNFCKGQLILKWPYEMTVSSKIPTKLFLDFCPKFFCSFLGASWKLFGLSGDLVCNTINKEAYRKPQKASREAPKKVQNILGQKSRNNFFPIWTDSTWFLTLTVLDKYRYVAFIISHLNCFSSHELIWYVV